MMIVSFFSILWNFLYKRRQENEIINILIIIIIILSPLCSILDVVLRRGLSLF